MFIPDRRLFVIGQDQRRSRTLARTMRLLCGIEFRGLDQGRMVPTTQPDAVVLGGVALTEVPTIRKVERALKPFIEERIPVLFLLDNPTTRDEVQARAVGASAVLTSAAPFQAVVNQVKALWRAHDRQDAHPRPIHEAAVEDVTCTLADLLIAAEAGHRVSPDLAHEAGSLLITAMAEGGLANWLQAVGHMHDPTYRHSLNVAGIMGAFVLHLGFSAQDCQRMVGAMLLHDVGKALIPVEIIDKPGILSPSEMAVMRTHAALGHELLDAQGGHDELTLQIVRSHHERLDGSGYPDALRGEQIPDPVRIASLCDVFAALIEPRPYKAEISPKDALEIMGDMAGKLDMTLLAAFRKVFAA